MTPSVDEASLAREVSGGYPVSMSTLPDTAAATVAAHALIEPGARRRERLALYMRLSVRASSSSISRSSSHVATTLPKLTANA